MWEGRDSSELPEASAKLPISQANEITTLPSSHPFLLHHSDRLLCYLASLDLETSPAGWKTGSPDAWVTVLAVERSIA